MSNDHAHIKATNELLEGWTGPVALRAPGGLGYRAIHDRSTLASWEGSGVVPHLDLEVPEARDRALRVLGARLGFQAVCCPLLEVETVPVMVYSLRLSDSDGTERWWYHPGAALGSVDVERLEGLVSLNPSLPPERLYAAAAQLLWRHVMEVRDEG